MLIRGGDGHRQGARRRLVHAASPRAVGLSVRVNCASRSGRAPSSELFGHEKGAFTGAVAQRRGRFESPTAAPSSSTDRRRTATTQVRPPPRSPGPPRGRSGGGQRPVPVNVRVVAATQSATSRRMVADLLPRRPLLPPPTSSPCSSRRCVERPEVPAVPRAEHFRPAGTAHAAHREDGAGPSAALALAAWAGRQRPQTPGTSSSAPRLAAARRSPWRTSPSTSAPASPSRCAPSSSRRGRRGARRPPRPRATSPAPPRPRPAAHHAHQPREEARAPVRGPRRPPRHLAPRPGPRRRARGASSTYAATQGRRPRARVRSRARPRRDSSPKETCGTAARADGPGARVGERGLHPRRGIGCGAQCENAPRGRARGSSTSAAWSTASGRRRPADGAAQRAIGASGATGVRALDGGRVELGVKRRHGAGDPRQARRPWRCGLRVRGPGSPRREHASRRGCCSASSTAHSRRRRRTTALFALDADARLRPLRRVPHDAGPLHGGGRPLRRRVAHPKRRRRGGRRRASASARGHAGRGAGVLRGSSSTRRGACRAPGRWFAPRWAPSVLFASTFVSDAVDLQAGDGGARGGGRRRARRPAAAACRRHGGWRRRGSSGMGTAAAGDVLRGGVQWGLGRRVRRLHRKRLARRGLLVDVAFLSPRPSPRASRCSAGPRAPAPSSPRGRRHRHPPRPG